MDKALLKHLEIELGEIIGSVTSVSGGDINEAFLIQSLSNSFFVKLNTYASGLQMFETEAEGLKIIGKTNKVRTPKVISLGSVGSFNYLVLEYIESRIPDFQSWKQFGQALAQLHQVNQQTFGLDHSNFIGPLKQHNNYATNWSSFYINQRLSPQINLAKSNHAIDTTTLSLFDLLFEKLDDLCPKEPPALTHGDLWNGNFLIDHATNQAVLIDPAISFAHREMDIAMTYLFGGFSDTFYQSYQDYFPLEPGIKERIDIYQLYYLMVHVNLFGRGYLKSVQQILKKYA